MTCRARRDWRSRAMSWRCGRARSSLRITCAPTRRFSLSTRPHGSSGIPRSRRSLDFIISPPEPGADDCATTRRSWSRRAAPSASSTSRHRLRFATRACDRRRSRRGSRRVNAPTRARVGGASARGASHVARGKPNQDSVGWRRQVGLWSFIAVADGHGASPHRRSDRGSRFAVEAALAVLEEAVEGGALGDPEALTARVAGLEKRSSPAGETASMQISYGIRSQRRPASPAALFMARPASPRRSATARHC